VKKGSAEAKSTPTYQLRFLIYPIAMPSNHRRFSSDIGFAENADHTAFLAATIQLACKAQKRC
jgi:hypothetical protein